MRFIVGFSSTVRQMPGNLAHFFSRHHMDIIYHPLRTATVSDLSCSIWSPLNNFFLIKLFFSCPVPCTLEDVPDSRLDLLCCICNTEYCPRFPSSRDDQVGNGDQWRVGRSPQQIFLALSGCGVVGGCLHSVFSSSFSFAICFYAKLIFMSLILEV